MIRWILAALLAVTLVANCSSDADTPSDTSAALPGPVPEGVTFRTPPERAPAAPEFRLNLLDDEVLVAEEQWSERPMVLVFFESWCELCRQQQPGINELVEEYRDIVLFVGVAGMSKEDELREYVEDNEVAYPVGVDRSGEVWLRYAAEEPPLVALVSKGGHVLRGWPGGLSPDELRSQIEELAIA
ncbi:MAG: TlpA family protein disulfide reductase [Nocardioidaceae bacterium]